LFGGLFGIAVLGRQEEHPLHSSSYPSKENKENKENTMGRKISLAARGVEDVLRQCTKLGQLL